MRIGRIGGVSVLNGGRAAAGRSFDYATRKSAKWITKKTSRSDLAGMKRLKDAVKIYDLTKKAISGGIKMSVSAKQRHASLYERKLAALEGLKKSLLHQAFSGEL